MRTAKEWMADLAAQADEIEAMSDLETEAHAKATIAAIQADALEAAAMICEQRLASHDTNDPPETRACIAAIRKLKEQS